MDEERAIREILGYVAARHKLVQLGWVRQGFVLRPKLQGLDRIDP